MIVLGIESSCDETAVAIVDGARILSSTVASQHDIHSKFGGVVPELASRRHVEMAIPLLKETLQKANLSIQDIDGVAVTYAPGLIGAILVGLSVAKSLAYALGRPLIGVNHLEGHLNAVHLTEQSIAYPHIGLIVSGGHTSLYLVEDFGKYKLLGSTRDDAAGEAFDKVARLLELGYPGGPIIDKLSTQGDPNAIRFKHPHFRDMAEFDYSFSGIKTAVLYVTKDLREKNQLDETAINNIASSFQRAVIDMLTKNIIKAAKKYKCKSVVVSGGVAANRGLRDRLKEIEKKEGLRIFVPPMDLCTDNAAMIAYVGGRRLEMGEKSDLTLNAEAVQEIGTI